MSTTASSPLSADLVDESCSCHISKPCLYPLPSRPSLTLASASCSSSPKARRTSTSSDVFHLSHLPKWPIPILNINLNINPNPKSPHLFLLLALLPFLLLLSHLPVPAHGQVDTSLWPVFQANKTLAQFGINQAILATDTANAGLDWGDMDNDGWLDLVVGPSAAGPSRVWVFRNMRNGTFSLAFQSAAFGAAGTPASWTAFNWIDYNRDGNLDILVTRDDATRLFRGFGDGTFTGPTVLRSGVLSQWPGGASGDLNGDSYVDFMVVGWSGDDNTTAVMTNNAGTGTFNYFNVGTGWPQLWNCVPRFVDFDNDGDLDVFATGNRRPDGVSTTYLMRNSNGGQVWQNVGASLPQVGRASVGWGDFDGDGWRDVFLNGWNLGDASGNRTANILRNNRDGTFSPLPTPPGMIGVGDGIGDVVDLDLDGFADIVYAGQRDDLSLVSKFFHSNGDGSFTEIPIPEVPGMWNGVIRFADFDRDDDIDIAVTSQSNVLRIIQGRGPVPLCVNGQRYSFWCNCAPGFLPLDCAESECTGLRCTAGPLTGVCVSDPVDCLNGTLPSANITDVSQEEPLPFQAPVPVSQATVVPVPSSNSPRIIATVTIPAGAITVTRSFANGTSDTAGQKTGLYVLPPDPLLLQAAGTDGVLSAVLDLSFPESVGKAFVLPILIEFLINNASTIDLTKICLAFINRTTQRWECEDLDLVLSNGPSGPTLRGETSHFTTFAVLLSADASDGGDSADGDGGGFETVYLAPIFVGVALLVVAVVIGIGIAFFIVKLKRWRTKTVLQQEMRRGTINFGDLTPRGDRNAAAAAGNVSGQGATVAMLQESGDVKYFRSSEDGSDDDRVFAV